MEKNTIYTDNPITHSIKLLGTTVLAIFAVTMLGGCVKDELHNTPHPDKGAVQITTDWSGLSEDAVQPESYLLRIGKLTHTVSGANNAFPYLLDEGSHTLLVHSMPHGITVDNVVATVNTLPDGTLEPMPDYLFSAVNALLVMKDDTLKVSVKMKQSLRILQLALKLNAGDDERIASTTATLTGIAQSIDLATGQADATGTGKTVAPDFQPGSIGSTRAEGQPALIANLRLAGVASGGKQILTLIVTLKDGTVQTFVTDLTEALKNFGKELKPLALDAVLALPQEGIFEGTITSWTVVENGNFTIH